jgi:hypothetical protein
VHGRTRAALRLESRAVELGARKAELLHVSVPSHCPLLQPIAKSLREQLRSMQIRDPQFVSVSNVKARTIRSAVGIATELADNIAHGVRWHDATKCGARIRLSVFSGNAVRSCFERPRPREPVGGRGISRRFWQHRRSSQTCSKLKSYCHLRAALARLTLEKCLERSSYQNTTAQQTNEESDSEKRLASPILRHSHFVHSKRVGRSPLISRAAHDQYATITAKCHVIQDRVFTQNA